MIRGDSWSVNEWLRCRKCGGDNLHVARYIGDRGGTESVEITCKDCGEKGTVHP